MKKRLISLLVALCMAVTLLPVSAITAWAEGGGQLKIVNGYPEGSKDDSNGTYTISCSGDGWSYDGTTQTLTLNPLTPTTYDLTAYRNIRKDENSILCSAIIGKNATIVNGNFWNVKNPGSSITNDGTITSGTYSMPVINHGTITGGIFRKKPTGGNVDNGYTLNVNSQQNGSYESFHAEIKDLGSSVYVIPNSYYNTSVTILYGFFDSWPETLFPIDVTFGNTNDTHCLLKDWAPSARYHYNVDHVYVTFTAPPAKADTVTLSKLTRLVIDENGYPVGTEGGTRDYSGNGWKFEKGNSTLTLESGSYDFSGGRNALRPLNPNIQLEVKSGAKLTGGAFAKEPKGAGTFKTVILNGTGSITAVNGLTSDWGNTLYVVKTGNNTITASEPILDINRILFENDSLYPNSSNKNTVCINIESLNSVSAFNPEADIILNQASHGLSLIMDSDGTPVIVNAPFALDNNYYNYYGDGWYVNKASDGMSHGTLYLTGGKTYNSYNFRFTDPVNKTGQLDAVKCGIVNEGSIIEDGIFNTLVANGWPDGDPTKTHKIEGGTFAAGLLYNDGTITGGAFNGKDSVLNKLLGSTVVSDTALSGDYRSVTVKDGAILKVNDTLPLVYNETTHDLVQGLAWDLYSYAGTVLTVKADADITNINGQKIREAFNSYYPNGETDKTVVCFEMPDSDVELNSTKIVVPDPKPEPER